MSGESVEAAVKATLLSLGISVDDPIASQAQFAEMRNFIKMATDPETQKDWEAIRKWRLAQEQVQRTALITAIGVAVTGILGAIVWAFKSAMHWPPLPPH